MTSAGTINLGAGMFIAVLPLLVLRDLALSPQVYGLALAVGGIGGILGSLVGIPIKNRFGEVRTMLIMQCAMPLAFASVAMAVFIPSPAVLWVGLSEFLFGMVMVIHTISSTGIRARVTPHDLMGRITAASRFVTLGAVPVGAVLGGALGGWFGYPDTVFIAAAVAAAAPIILRTSPLGRMRTIPKRWEAEHWTTRSKPDPERAPSS